MVSAQSLDRFVQAQQFNFKLALAEVKQGRKQNHWMWYIFPQHLGLGYTETSKFYAIQDMEEAKAYLSHQALGSRLIQISNELLKLADNDAGNIFGSPDDLKLKSCMTLFSLVSSTNPVFQLVLDKFFKGRQDQRTIQLLSYTADY